MPEHPLAAMEKLDPAFMKYLRDSDCMVYDNGALPRKVKLLMAMAFDAAAGADQGVRALAHAAMREGATKEEIAEALRVAYHLTGVGAIYTASAGLKEIVEADRK